MRLSSIVLPLLLATPALADDAPRPAAPTEKKDKSKPAKPTKVYTDEDLKNAGQDGKGGKGTITFLSEPSGQSESGQTGSGQSGSSDSVERSSESSSEETARRAGSEGESTGESRESSSESGRAEGEAGWRAQARAHREALRNIQAEIDKVDAKLSELRNPQQQPQPIEALQPDPQRRLTKGEDRIELDKQLEELRKALADAQKAYDDFLERARRANVPPGWVEER